MSTRVRLHRSGSGGLLVGIGKFLRGSVAGGIDRVRVVYIDRVRVVCQSCVGSE